MEETIDKKNVKFDNVIADAKIGKLTIEDGKTKYTLWMHKKDTSETVAYEMFKTISGDAIGKTFCVKVKEMDKSFSGREGKTIQYIDRTIISFVSTDPVEGSVPTIDTKTPVGGENAPTVGSAPSTTNPDGLYDRVDTLEEKVEYLLAQDTKINEKLKNVS